MEKMELKALAKINLGLDVLGVREDGYHDVRMVMQSVYLYDRVVIERTVEKGIFLTANLDFLPTGPTNIAYKAAALLMEEFSLPGGLRITLDKRIPVAAGLAGGSSNAAAVLYGMNRLFGLGLSKGDLMKRGAGLGADVPYCILRGTVLAEGIGEKLTVLPQMPGCSVLLAKPPFSVSTKRVYQALDAKRQVRHPDMAGLLSGLQEGNLDRIAACMGNVLEAVTAEKYPSIRELKQEMRANGAIQAMMSGSGPTVFGLFKEKADAMKAREQIRKKKLARQVYVTNIHNARRDERNGIKTGPGRRSKFTA